MCRCQAYGKTGVPNTRGFCLVCGERVTDTCPGYEPDHNGECLHCDEPADAHDHHDDEGETMTTTMSAQNSVEAKVKGLVLGAFDQVFPELIALLKQAYQDGFERGYQNGYEAGEGAIAERVNATLDAANVTLLRVMQVLEIPDPLATQTKTTTTQDTPTTTTKERRP